MKKYLTALVLAVVIVPQVAFASWWNPFSWGVFHGADTKTQILETRVKELERKLESKASTTVYVKEKLDTETIIKKAVSSSTKSSIKEKPKALAPTQGSQESVQNPQATAVKTKEYLGIIVSKLAPAAAYLGVLPETVDKLIPVSNTYISGLNSLISENELLKTKLSSSYFINDINEINDYYRTSIKFENTVIAALLNIKNDTQKQKKYINDISDWLAKPSTWEYLSKSDFERIDGDLQKISDSLSQSFGLLQTITTNTLNFHELSSKGIKTLLNLKQKQWENYIITIPSTQTQAYDDYRMSSNSMVNWMKIAPIVIQTTNCSVNVSPVGNSASVNCTSY